MVFSSLIFLFYFLPAALVLYYAAPARYRHLVLTLMSYFFYGWANPLFVVLMFTSTIIDYTCGRVLMADPERSRRSKLALLASICTNLSLLGFFKYFHFGVDSYNAALHLLGLSAQVWHPVMRVTLPLGISFYTFQSMSYTFDVYRKKATGICNIIDFACYVSMFPQLVAGPIVRFQDIADQLKQRSHNLTKVSRGIAFFSLGLAKKVLLANTCGKVADVVFHAAAPSCLEAWYGTVAYSFQIYFDFSGYSDMAIGLGFLFGFSLPRNFNSPYRSGSITEFWQRWHISLSTWLRDYLYIPLGGNRKGMGRTYANLLLVMLIGGLWHGASWNFVLWGGLHGLFLAVERLCRHKKSSRSIPKYLRVPVCFACVSILWVLFRAEDLPHALSFYRTLAGDGTAAELSLFPIIFQPYYIIGILAACFVMWAFPNTWRFTEHMTISKAIWILALLVFSVVMLTTQSFNPFIYFIF
jgi:alginate O-acetyltransferase complex protein AlgI